MGHKPFLVLADHLTRQGIAVLRYDDRGVGKSKGDFGTATTVDFSHDAEAAVDFLLSRQEIDPHRVGVVGHSEGGLIATMLAARRADLAQVVLLAGPGVAGDEIVRSQSRAIYEAAGLTGERLEETSKFVERLITAIETEAEPGDIETLFEEFTADDEFSGDDSMQTVAKLQAQQMSTPWFRYFVQYDPASDLRKVQVPVLAMIGEKDLQVLSELNLPALREALAASGQSDFRCEQLAGLNHLFQACQTGSPAEYEAIEETMNPAALNMIADWILAH